MYLHQPHTHLYACIYMCMCERELLCIFHTVSNDMKHASKECLIEYILCFYVLRSYIFRYKFNSFPFFYFSIKKLNNIATQSTKNFNSVVLPELLIYTVIYNRIKYLHYIFFSFIYGE